MLQGREIECVVMLREPGYIQKSKCGKAFIVRHPAAKAVLNIASGQRWVGIRHYGGEAKAYAQAEAHLTKWRSQFEALAHQNKIRFCVFVQEPRVRILPTCVKLKINYLYYIAQAFGQ